jgi:hypothetical protein
MRIKNMMNYDQNDCPNSFFFIIPLFLILADTLKNKSWRRCRLYFRGRMQCWWIFDFETGYTYLEFVVKFVKTNLMRK